MLLSSILSALTLASTATAHLYINYPGWRGNNLHDNFGNTTECVKGTDDDYDGGRGCFPYGMQWMYPCGGLGVSSNRTYWPTTGGAVSFEPGWFMGHSSAYIYINIGIGTLPPNMSHPAVPVFSINGPTNLEYPGRQICIGQVGMPANLSLTAGTNITIQVVEAAKHGAALYSCVDVTLTDDMSLVEEVTRQNCYNDSSITFNQIYTQIELSMNAAGRLAPAGGLLVAAVFALAFLAA